MNIPMYSALSMLVYGKALYKNIIIIIIIINYIILYYYIWIIILHVYSIMLVIKLYYIILYYIMAGPGRRMPIVCLWHKTCHVHR